MTEKKKKEERGEKGESEEKRGKRNARSSVRSRGPMDRLEEFETVFSRSSCHTLVAPRVRSIFRTRSATRCCHWNTLTAQEAPLTRRERGKDLTLHIAQEPSMRGSSLMRSETSMKKEPLTGPHCDEKNLRVLKSARTVPDHLSAVFFCALEFLCSVECLQRVLCGS